MDWTERWIRALLMYIFYDRDRHLTVVAYLEFRGSAFIPILSFLRWGGGDFIFDESACEAWNWTLASNWAAMRRGSEIGNFNDSRAIAASRSHRFFFFFSFRGRVGKVERRSGPERIAN